MTKETLPPDEKAVVAVMMQYKLQPGQMLLLGPQSVRILKTPGAFTGKLPDKFVLEREEWDPRAVPS